MPMYFLSMHLNGFITLTNSLGVRGSNWQIPLWIFISANFCSSTANSFLFFQFFMACEMNFMILSDIFYIFRLSILKVHRPSFCQFMPWLYFPPCFALLFDMLINVQ